MPMGPRIPFWAAVACFGLFVVVVAPWFARQLAVFGSISPSSQSGRVLFIREIAEWNSVLTPTTLEYLLGQGMGPLIASRIGGFIAAVGIFSVLIGSLFLVPFMAIGAWLRRRSVDFGPFFVYGGILFAFSAIVSAVHVPGGTFIHSAVALAPHGYVLALEGVAAIVAWIAARRPRWDREAATRVFTAAAVGFGIVAAVFGAVTVQGRWDEKRDVRATLGDALVLAGAAPEDRLMTIDAAGFDYVTGHGGVVTTNDPLDTQKQIAEAYRTSWLILERDEISTSMAAVLQGRARPPWIGAPVFTIASHEADNPVPRAAIYPICLSPADQRCAVVASATR
jgi:hypothetical protein